MIKFKPITLDQRELYEKYLLDGTERGCDYSFVNLYRDVLSSTLI